jgi:hypothetical protein
MLSFQTLLTVCYVYVSFGDGQVFTIGEISSKVLKKGSRMKEIMYPVRGRLGQKVG